MHTRITTAEIRDVARMQRAAIARRHIRAIHKIAKAPRG